MRIIGKVFIGEKNPETYPQDRQELVEKYKPHFKKITDFLLYMYTDIPQYQEFLQEIVSRGQEPRVSYETEWSKKELDGAEYLMIFTTNQIHEPLVDDPNTHYRPKSESCKKYVDQTSDLKIKKKYAGKWDFYFPYEMEFAVSPSLRELFEAEGIQGMSYRPIYTNRVAIGGHE